MTDPNVPLRLVSVERLSERSKNSTGEERQGEGNERYAQAYNHTIVDHAPDMDVSGNVPMWERPKAGPWMNDASKRAQYDGFIFSALDRLGRNARHISAMRDWAEDHGKVLIVRSPHLIWPPEEDDLASPIMWDLLARLAEYELKAITKRIKETREWLEANGFLVGSYPYGYTTMPVKNSKLLVPEPAQAKIVETIFDLRIGKPADDDKPAVAGKSTAEIAEYLTEQGEYTPSDLTSIAKGRTVESPSPWSKSTVNRILRNPIYKGIRVYGSKRNVLRVEPIVDAGVWRKVQAILASESVHGGGPRPQTVKALLLDVIKCGVCNGKMYRARCGPKEKRVEYYRCHGVDEHTKGCGVMVRVTDADAYAAKQVAGWFDDPYMIDDPDFAWKLHTEEIAEIDQLVHSLDDDDADYDEKHAALRAERKRLVKLDEEAEQATPEKVPSGKTIGQEWAERDQVGKREFLLERGCKIQVVVSKTHGANGRPRNSPTFSIGFGRSRH
jgi:DNA invertase Pin-like site-specific DNA recombinase